MSCWQFSASTVKVTIDGTHQRLIDVKRAVMKSTAAMCHEQLMCMWHIKNLLT